MNGRTGTNGKMGRNPFEAKRGAWRPEVVSAGVGSGRRKRDEEPGKAAPEAVKDAAAEGPAQPDAALARESDGLTPCSVARAGLGMLATGVVLGLKAAMVVRAVLIPRREPSR